LPKQKFAIRGGKNTKLFFSLLQTIAKFILS
jgi:hypothetical protein